MYKKITTLVLLQMVLIILVILILPAKLNLNSEKSLNKNSIVTTEPTTVSLTSTISDSPELKPTPSEAQKILPSTTPDSRCIIIIDGKKYDVTLYRNQHSGGDIFNCGTDMSNIFHGKHGQRYLQMMQQYAL
jgi:cytochrome b involved in lipid metabolism